MYKLHLIFKYLRKRRIAWVSLVAVTLCTAMVLVVISVMGGWLRMFREINHGLVGDLVIGRQSEAGFKHYEEILAAVRKMPGVRAAVPMLTTYGIVDIDGQIQSAVQVQAYGDLDQVGQVNSFQRGLYRQYVQPMQEIQDDPKLSADEKQKRQAQLAATPPTFDKPMDPEVYRERLSKPGFDAAKLQGMIVGINVIISKREDGSDTRSDYMYRAYAKLSVLGISNDLIAPSAVSRTYWIVDDCRTKFYPVDAKTVYVPFDTLQSDMGMASYTYQQQIGDKTVDRVEPARVNAIELSLRDGVDLEQGLTAVRVAVDGIEQEYPLEVSPEDPVVVQPWEQRQAAFLSAVEKEKVLMTFLFGIISVVAVFLVFCIFFMIVVEKTRDIGIIKSVGASNAGVAQIFLGYGLAIGVLGAGVGLLMAYLIIHNINAIHAWMGRAMGIKIWDPQTYMFDTIPSTMQAGDVMWIVGIAVLSAVLGALVPAVRASRMNPVEALRWE
jgi:lipoprotein-releasing system permease protein